MNVADALRFDAGIAHISRTREAPIERLPDSAGVLPGRERIADELAQLLGSQGLDEQLLAELVPPIADPQLLFADHFTVLVTELAQLFEEDRRSPASAAASDVLAEELRARDLLASYRVSLLAA